MLDQDYPNLEYFVVDGGSTDGSQEIIEKYAVAIDWWVSEKDMGQAEAINKGFARATGEYIAWLNSDDMYQPGAIQAAVKALQDHPGRQPGLWKCVIHRCEGEPFNLMTYGNWGLVDLMCFKIIGQPGVFMRRADLLKAGLLDLSYRFLLDHHLWLRIAQHGKMLYVPETWASARMHPKAKNVASGARFRTGGVSTGCLDAIPAGFARSVQEEPAAHLGRCQPHECAAIYWMAVNRCELCGHISVVSCNIRRPPCRNGVELVMLLSACFLMWRNIKRTFWNAGLTC